MERVTVRFPKEQINELEEKVEEGQYPNKSEAIRNAVRDMIDSSDTVQKNDGRRPKMKQ